MTPPTLFTARQAQVLELLMQGLSNIEIGRDLNISKSAVKHHVSRMAKRCGISGKRLRTPLVMKFREDSPEPRVPVLNDIEREIFRMVALGKSNPEIGKFIGRHADTVRRRISAIFDKFGVWNRLELALKYPSTDGTQGLIHAHLASTAPAVQVTSVIPSLPYALYRYCNQ